MTPNFSTSNMHAAIQAIVFWVRLFRVVPQPNYRHKMRDNANKICHLFHKIAFVACYQQVITPTHNSNLETQTNDSLKCHLSQRSGVTFLCNIIYYCTMTRVVSSLILLIYIGGGKSGDRVEACTLTIYFLSIWNNLLQLS